MTTPSPAFKVWCGARGCTWSVTSNVEGELTSYYEAHVVACHADEVPS